MRRALCPSFRRLLGTGSGSLPPLVLMPALALGCYASTELEEVDPGMRLRLEVSCLPQYAPDGTLRCLPTDWLSARANSWRETGPFADPACTELAVQLFAVRSCEQPRWVPVLGPSESCEGASDIVSYHPVEDLLEAIYRRDPATGACEPDEIFPAHDAYRLGAPTPFERFAAGELVVE